MEIKLQTVRKQDNCSDVEGAGGMGGRGRNGPVWVARAAFPSENYSGDQNATLIRKKPLWLGREAPPTPTPPHPIREREEWGVGGGTRRFPAKCVSQTGPSR